VNKPTWAAAAEEGENLGGLLGAPLYGPMGGFGRFLLVILALSIVANNIPNMYSFALTFQAFGKFAQSIPRMFLVCIGTAIYIVLAILGADHFKSTFDTLLVILSYWLMIYSVILVAELFSFREGAVQTGSKLPTGYAALGATAVGAAGVVLGMAQTWYVGVVGIKIGGPPYGGDIGFEMAGSFAAIAYPGLRYLEKKYTGR
jgi:purine-cytosine permease-like protein